VGKRSTIQRKAWVKEPKAAHSGLSRKDWARCGSTSNGKSPLEKTDHLPFSAIWSGKGLGGIKKVGFLLRLKNEGLGRKKKKNDLTLNGS